MAKLEGRVALITGAGSGIGRAAAIRLAQEGAKVGLLDLEPKELEAVQKEIKSMGGKAVSFPADVSNPEQVRMAVEKLIDSFGRLDIVFANAGINGVWAPLEDLTPEDWDKTLAVNLKGTFLTVRDKTQLL